jgi:MerR family transcriptional regulator, Zn(II)-responsive regulator of zntA
VSQKHEQGACQASGLRTTGELARCSGNTLRTVRFYEESGLLESAQRTDRGQRLFGEPQLARLLLITDLRAAGLSLREIREVLEAKQKSKSSTDAASDLTRRLRAQVETMRARQAALDRLVRDLEDTCSVLEGCAHCSPAECAAGCRRECQILQGSLGSDEMPSSLRVLWLR